MLRVALLYSDFNWKRKKWCLLEWYLSGGDRRCSNSVWGSLPVRTVGDFFIRYLSSNQLSPRKRTTRYGFISTQHISLVHRTSPYPVYITKSTPRSGSEISGKVLQTAVWFILMPRSLPGWKVAEALGSFYPTEADLGQSLVQEDPWVSVIYLCESVGIICILWLLTTFRLFWGSG